MNKPTKADLPTDQVNTPEGSGNILQRFQDEVRRFFTQSHQRTNRARQHIFSSFFIKGCSIAISFFLVPITLHYIDKEQYGIWLTLSSIVAWLSFFDIGLGSGLRNKLSEALAEGNMEQGRSYVSSAYAMLILIFSGIAVVFFTINPFLNWSGILNTKLISADELRLIAVISFSFFFVSFVLKLLYAIFLAHQRPALTGLLNLLGNALSLIIILLLTNYTEGSLIKLALAVSFSPLVVLVLGSLFFFHTSYRHLRPALHYVNKAYFSDLLRLGAKFFVVGITVLVIFSTDKIIITQIFGPAEVPAYEVAHKYFYLITSAFAIISAPFWSAYTEAYVKREYDWIRKTVRSLIRTWKFLVLASILLLLISKPFYAMWVPGIEVPFRLSFFMFLFVIILSWGNIFVIFINGVSKVRLQLIVSTVGAILNIPLSYFFAVNCGLGTAGVILASTISIGYGPILAPIQYRKLMAGTATGIWNK